MTGKEFAEICRGTAGMLDVLAKQAASAGDDQITFDRHAQPASPS